MEFKEYRAKTVNDAITDALIELETTSDKIEYEVIEEGSSGLLGLFSKDAIIRVRRIEEPEFEEEIIELKATLAEEQPVKPEKPAKEEKPAKKSLNEKKPRKAKEEKEPVKSEPEAPKKPEDLLPLITGKEAENKDVNAILNVIFEKLEIQAEITTSIDPNERVVNIVVDGDDTGEIIGKRGQTLDAIQYLLSIIINKEKENYYRVKLDTNNYRERRQKTLENLAKNVASKVKKTHKKVALEPMNPYERRVIHSYLQSDKFVTTKSEGEEPNRRVVVYYKKS